MMYTILLIVGGVFTSLGIGGSILVPLLINQFGDTMYGELYVNGALVNSQYPISAYVFMIFPIVFLLIGLPLLIFGIRGKMKHAQLKKLGQEKFGIIANIYESNVVVNDRPELKADVYIVEDTNRVNMYSDTIGFDWNLYAIGDYVKLKHHGNMIDVLHVVNETSVPMNIKQLLNESTKNIRKNLAWQQMHTVHEISQDEILIDGVKYKKE